MEKMNENETKDMAVQVRDYQTELEQIMRSNVSPRVLKDRISDYHENDIASSFEVLTRDERERLYRILDAEQLSDIFEYLDNAEIYFEELNARKKVEVLSCMEVDQAAALLKPPGVCFKLLITPFWLNSPLIVCPGPPVPVPNWHPPWIINPLMIRWKVKPS